MSSPLSPRAPRRWLTALAIGVLSLSACAQPGPSAAPPPGSPSAEAMAPRHAERHARMQAWQAKRLDALKAKLQLGPAQEGDWTRFTTALQARPTPAGPHAQHRQHQQELQQLSTPERLDRMKALHAQHQAEMNATMERRAEATKAFYATLTPEQKKVFDAETARLMDGHHRHGPGGHGGHHGMSGPRG